MSVNVIERDLNHLKEQLGQHGAKIDDVLKEVRNLSPTQLDLYSEAFQAGLPYITDGIIDAIAAGKSGNPFAISIASLSVFSGFLTLAGPMTGPVGPLIQALTGLLSSILGVFLPAGPSLGDELREALKEFLEKERLDKLGAAADQIWLLIAKLGRGDRDWTPLNLFDGNQVDAIDQAWQVLLDPAHQSSPRWGLILERTCRLFTQLLRAVTLSLAYPRAGAQRGEMLPYLPYRMELFLDHLRKITHVAQRRGTFWHLGSNAAFGYQEQGNVWTCDSIVRPDFNWLWLGGGFAVMTATLNQGQAGEPHPVVTLLTLHPPKNPRPGYDKNHFFKPKEQAFGVRSEWPPACPQTELVSNDPSHPLKGSYDIFARPANERYPGGIFFYTANGNEIRGYIQDANEHVSFAWSQPVAGGRKAGLIRVVDKLRGFRDDPDENPTTVDPVLKDITWVIYAGCEVSTGQDILVRAEHKREGAADSYVAAPWRNFRGMGVDRGYLWVYRAGDIACATHTSIRKAVKEHRQPSWMTYKGFPSEVLKELSLEERCLSGLVDLCPCDDGTLVAAFVEGKWKFDRANDLKLFMLTPRIDRRKKELAFDFVRIHGEGFRVWKEPLFCWPLLEETTATLEEQTKIPAKQVRSLLRDVVANMQELKAAPAR